MDCPETLPAINADCDKISQVLSNLLSNALKYTPSGGRVSLMAEARMGDILICVTDNGPGIPPEIMPKIFQPYFTTKGARQGTGLGLNIVQRLIKEGKGALHVQTRVGEGTTFTVYVPAGKLLK